MTVAEKPIFEPISNAEMRLPYCEKCGKSGGEFHTHHIRSRGAGGSEARANKINLCPQCHADAQEYRIKPYELFIIAARREKVTVREVYEAAGVAVPDNIDEMEQIAQKEESFLKTAEDIISSLISLQQDRDHAQFVLGQGVDVLKDRGLTLKWVASQLRISQTYARQLYQVYRAFPEESDRVAELSWTHHRIATDTGEPHSWIKRAADGQMSTREMIEAVKKETGQEKTPRDRAEEAVRKVKKVLEEGGSAADWLLDELEELINNAKQQR